MAVSMSAEQVIQQIFDETEGEENSEEENAGERLKRALSSALIDGEVDKELFLSSCACILEPLYELCPVEGQKVYGQGARVLASQTVHASVILKDEARLWLKAIHRQLARKVGYRNAYRGQISCDIPSKIFAIFAKVINNCDRFWHTFLLPQQQQWNGSYSNNIYSPHQRAVCVIVWPSYGNSYFLFQTNRCIWFKRRAQSLASEEKDFIFTYNKNQGKLFISFHFGEWNVNGLAQHS